MIRLEFNPRKFASAAAYIAERKPSVTKKELCKLMFFADQQHLLRFGRTITGDKYHALRQGPVPSNGQLIGNIRLRANRKADLRVFSRSDIKVLGEVLDRMGQLSAEELERLSHREAAWKKAKANGKMDFDLFFEGHPGVEEMREMVRLEHQPRSKLLRWAPR